MTAIVGGLWDALLGEGRRFWIVASSDSRSHYTEPVRAGSDFWPGEFHKNWVPRAPDLRRRPRRPAARPHVRGRPGTW